MKGDFSRIRFNRQKGYTAVLEQQGRVALDADANEQCFINDYLRRSEASDVIGAHGAPSANAGFQIAVTPDGEIQIGAGRYYVNGLLCENAAPISYDNQQYLLDPAPSGANLLSELAAAGIQAVIQVYLEAWQRLVTALDDPRLREPALGQADTTVRLQTVWRVVASLQNPAPSASAATPANMTPCCQAMYQTRTGGSKSAGTMSAETSGPSSDSGCTPSPSSGYQGVENQLYRVEIHTTGDETKATFKWSRENGSVVSAVTGISGGTVEVNSLGPDANLGFQVQGWVELSDDSDQFGQTPNQPGDLYQVQSIQPSDPSLTLMGTVTTVNLDQNARVRRWDQTGSSASSTGIPLSAGTEIPLENGIQVCFGKGWYQTGDYWTFPARAATGTIDWPLAPGGVGAALPPHSTRVHRAPLACIHLNNTVDDCRMLFDPLTGLTPAKAMRVESVSWANDDVITLDELVANGLTIQFDQVPSGPINGANFIVTVEAPVAGSYGSPPSTLLRTIEIVDAQIKVAGQTLSWVLPADNELNLDQFLPAGGPPARVRIKLLGEMIFANVPVGLAFLDGRALGQPGVRADGKTPRITLQLPSGGAATASDFDAWFYLAPPLEIQNVAVGAYLAGEDWPSLVSEVNSFGVVVNSANEVIGLNAEVGDPDGEGSDWPVVEIAGVVSLNYAAVAAVTLALSLAQTASTGTAASGGSVASVPPTAAIAIGQSAIAFPISIIANPGGDASITYELTATLSLPGTGFATTRSASFTVAGMVPPSPYGYGSSAIGEELI